jgi:hypothetical protein
MHHYKITEDDWNYIRQERQFIEETEMDPKKQKAIL